MGINLELMAWGDGTIRLVHWDHENGDDTVLILSSDGSASKAILDDDEQEIVTPVNLGQALLNMLEKHGHAD